MRALKRLILVAIAVTALCAAATAKAGGRTYVDSIRGYEYYFTSTEGRFAGTASGALPGSWNARVHHTPLCYSCDPTATIDGGSFSLATIYHGQPALVTGTFTGGTVQVMNRGANCTNQTFDVEGRLGNVGLWYRGHGTGMFSATLTHFRHRVFGVCVTYAASVSGSLSLTF
jgi:hypothetical protein